jgi:serine protease Do
MMKRLIDPGVKARIDKMDDEMATIIENGRRSLVKIEDGRRGTGAGTIIHAGGLLVSNAHVVRQQQPRITTWDGRQLQGRLLARSERYDLAAIAVDAQELPVLPLANGRELRTGQWVVALGHPWGIPGVASAGMVIDVGRPLEALPYDGALIQVGLHLRPGHSGGPMLNDKGELIGINTMIAGPYVGLAVPIQTVKRFLKEALGTPQERTAPRPQPVPVA